MKRARQKQKQEHKRRTQQGTKTTLNVRLASCFTVVFVLKGRTRKETKQRVASGSQNQSNACASLRDAMQSVEGKQTKKQDKDNGLATASISLAAQYRLVSFLN